LGLSTSAQATPVMYELAGTATITAFSEGESVLVGDSMSFNIDFGELMLDDVADAIILHIGLDGPIQLDFTGLVTQSAVFEDASLAPVGDVTEIIPGFFQLAGVPTLIEAMVELDNNGNPVQVSEPDGSTSGTIFQTLPEAIEVDITGITLAAFFDGFDPSNPLVDIKIDLDLDGLQMAPVPEPMAALLFGLGFVVVGLNARRRT
jgi:hypothetical protein